MYTNVKFYKCEIYINIRSQFTHIIYTVSFWWVHSGKLAVRTPPGCTLPKGKETILPTIHLKVRWLLVYQREILSETNIAPENGWLEY